MRRILLFAVLLFVIPFVFAKTFNYYPVQGVQEPFQKDSAALTQLPSWNSSNQITGEITFSQVWGSPMYVNRANTTQTQRFAVPCTIVGNKTSCITGTMRKGSYFSHPGFTDMAVGRYQQCTRNTARCVNSTFERCVGGFWVSIEQCKRSEVCTSTGCRISIYPYASTARYLYTSRYPYITIKPIPIGRTIGAVN